MTLIVRASLGIAALVAASCMPPPSQPLQLLRTESGRQVRWDPDRFPLRVRVPTPKIALDNSPYEDCRLELEWSVAWINRIAERQLLELSSAGDRSADVVVDSWDERYGRTKLATDPSGAIRSAQVRLPCSWSLDWQLRSLAVHELLHVLGFALSAHQLHRGWRFGLHLGNLRSSDFAILR